MRARIHKSLLMMGVISVALAFLLAIILHYQSMQEQADRELARGRRRGIYGEGS